MRLLKYLFILFVTAFVAEHAAAQNQRKIDSIENVIAGGVNDTTHCGLLMIIANEYRVSDIPKATAYLEQAIEYARTGNHPTFEASCFNNLANCYFSKADFVKAGHYYEEGLKIYQSINSRPDIARMFVNVGMAYQRDGKYDFSNAEYRKALFIREELKDKKEQGNIYNYFANNYYRKGNYPEAIQHYLKSLSFREELDDKVGMANCLIGIGIVLKQQQEFEQSLMYYKRGLKIFEDINDLSGIALVLNNIGTIESNLNQYENALRTHQHSLDIKLKLNDTEGIGFSYYNIGNCYLYLGKYDEALTYHKKALAIREKAKDKLNISNSYYEIGEVEEKRGNIEEAIAAYNKSLKLAQEIKYDEGIRTAYHGLSSAYKVQKNVSKAFEYYKLFTTQKDSTLNVENKRIVSELQTQYETEKKEQQIAFLNKEKAFRELELREKELEIQKSKLVQYGLIAALIILILLAYLFYNHYKLKQQTRLEKEKAQMKKEQIDAVITAQEEERKRFAQELHDGIGSMMAVLKMNMSRLETDVHPEQLPVFNQTISMIDETYHELRNISHNLMPQALMNHGLLDALNDFKDRVNKSGNLNIILGAFAVTRRLNPEIEISLYRVVQEIITNIIKYSGAHNTNIQLVEHERYISLVIEDDGNGFDPKTLETSKGNGWYNICSRLDMINANIDIDSSPMHKGTTIIIDVPIAA